MCRFAAPFKVIWATSWFMDRAHALTDLQGKTSKFLLVYGARAAPRGRGVQGRGPQLRTTATSPPLRTSKAREAHESPTRPLRCA